ncbi:hypothetical protein Y032_0021g369 [Ancylostoma ceylanicum]|nr:hypothetical protein Y032_0021g369 [Ancylostoma ceylanicum]
MINIGERFIFERPDLTRKWAPYLSAVERARANNCFVYIDETWVFPSMTKKKEWNNNTILRFVSASKNKGRRAIVIGAITEHGIVPGCTKVLINGRTGADQDYHH